MREIHTHYKNLKKFMKIVLTCAKTLKSFSNLELSVRVLLLLLELLDSSLFVGFIDVITEVTALAVFLITFDLIPGLFKLKWGHLRGYFVGAFASLGSRSSDLV